MALKRGLNDDERFGLTQEELKAAVQCLRKNKTAGALDDREASRLYEMYLLGDSLSKIALQFPEYTYGQVCLTAALRKWAKDRERMLHTLQDRVRAKVVRSVLEQVDFLTSLMSVANTEHLSAMTKYCQDPISNPKPDLRIGSIKEYKETVETLYKIVAGATNTGQSNNGQSKNSPMFDALTPMPKAQIDELNSKKQKKQLNDKDINILDLESND